MDKGNHPMTALLPPDLSYLTQPGTVVLSATGNGSITFRPDVGQYWLPIIVQCAVKDPFGFLGSDTNCFLYSGGPPGLTDVSFLRDITTQGQNDVSSILSGT